jgi:hypothetical protein
VERLAFSETEALEKVDSMRDFAKMRTETEAESGRWSPSVTSNSDGSDGTDLTNQAVEGLTSIS